MADEASRGPLAVLWASKGLGPGGAEQLLVSAARTHDRAKVRAEAAYALAWKDHLAPLLEGAGVPARSLGVRSGADPRWVWRLARLVRSGRFDVVHAHSPLVAAAARLAVRSMRPRRRPAMVVTEHNTWRTFGWPTRLANAVTYPLDDARIAVSDDARQSIWWRGARDRTEVLTHGIDLAEVRREVARRAELRTEWGVEPGEVVIGTVANYRPEKAYADLFAAAGEVLARSPRTRFVAVGQGPLAHEVAARHKALGAGDRFLLLGYRPDARAVLGACDAFVLASHREGLPVALMEAMALGLPVVATRVGGIPQAVEDGVSGYLVEASDTAALAERLITVAADDGTRARVGEAARAASARFDASLATRRIEAVYQQVAPRARRRRPIGPQPPRPPDVSASSRWSRR